MILGTKIKWYSHLNKNAPILGNEWGSLIKVLDACLIDGFSEQQANKATIVGNFLTLSFPQPHLYQQYQILSITGASASVLNGTHCIYDVSPDGLSLTIEYESLLGVVETSLLINTKLSSLGWAKVYSADKKAVYKFKLNTGGFNYLYVDDTLPTANYNTTWSKYARLGLSEGYAGEMNPQGSSSPPDWSFFPASISGTETLMGWNKHLYAAASDATSATYNPKSVPADGSRMWHFLGDETYYQMLNGIIPNSTWCNFYAVGEYETIHQGFKSNSFISAMTNNTLLTNGSVGYVSAVISGLEATNCFTRILKSYTQDTEQPAYPLSLVGLDFSGYRAIFSTSGPVNHLRVLLKSNDILLGSYKNTYWLPMVRPYRHLQKIQQGSEIYMAFDLYVNTGNIGQVVLKIGSKD